MHLLTTAPIKHLLHIYYKHRQFIRINETLTARFITITDGQMSNVLECRSKFLFFQLWACVLTTCSQINFGYIAQSLR